MVDKEEYRARIIRTASRIFSHYGFRKTTMDEISRALKKGKSSIYYYFPGKEEIFEAVVLYEANQLRRRLTAAIKEVDSPPDKLRNYIYVRMREFAKLSNYYNAVFDKNLDHYEFIEKIRARYDREELAIIRLLVYVGNNRVHLPWRTVSIPPWRYRQCSRGWRFRYSGAGAKLTSIIASRRY